MRYVVVLVLAIGCQREPPPPVGVPAIPVPAPVPALAVTSQPIPFAMFNQLVADDGRVVKVFGAVSRYELAIPDGPNQFRLGDQRVDASTSTIAKAWPAAEVVASSLVRHEPDGRIRWSVPIGGTSAVAPSELAFGTDRIVAKRDGVIRAFDDATGAEVWHTRGFGYPFYARGDAVYAYECEQHMVVARALADGKERFHVPLMMECEPRITIDDAHVFVLDGYGKTTHVLDLHGGVVLSLAEELQATAPVAGGTLIVTDKQVAMLEDSGHVRWQLPGPVNEFVGGDEVVTLPGGDVIVANYGMIADSGVDVMRLRPSDGTIVWHANVHGLGVAHSKYRQLVYLELRGDDLYVVSQASGGGYFEKLGIADGVSKSRITL
jgi:outer membrane protein assembly factor BamB